MTDQARPPICEFLPGNGVHKRGQFRVDRLFDQLARSIAQDVRERVGYKTRWIGQFVMVVSDLLHIPFSAEN